MKCANCQHENAESAKFCEECAAPLGRWCASCGTLVSYSAKFCSECGRPLDPVTNPKAELEDDRKQLTVLFADITGSIDIIATHDAEVARKTFLTPILERMIEAVDYYSGTVSSVRGDGIMALFGAPRALEDHAVRGCYAGLRMQEFVGQYAEELQRSHGVSVKIRV